MYLLLRPRPVVMSGWLEVAGLGAWVSALREAVAPWRAGTPAWVLYNLPDGLWVYAACCFFGRVWMGPRRSTWMGAALAVLAAALGMEALQGAGWLQGRADGWDAVAECAGFVLAVLQLQRRSTEEKP